MKHALVGVALCLATTAAAVAQDRRMASPQGSAATQVGGIYDARGGWVQGKWIELRYGRPLKRGRDLFGADDFVEFLNDGADVWRAGANYSTRLITEVDLRIADTTVPAGEYTVFIELGHDAWNLIVSTWPAQKAYDYENKDALFGAFYYTPDRDLLRTPMQLQTQPHSFDQLSWQFLDMTPEGGRLALLWDRKLASVPFEIVSPE